MITKLTTLCAAAALLIPASAFAQDAIAVALGASFEQVTVVSTTSSTGAHTGTVVIPSQDFSATGTSTGPFWPYPVSNVVLNGATDGANATYSGTSSSSGATTSTENVLASISVAAAFGEHAVASAGANRHGTTGANSGSSMTRGKVLAASTSVGGGASGSFTSQVLVNGQ